MTDDAHTPPPDTPDSDDVDPGEPLELLAELRQTPTLGFLGGIRRRIQRRNLAADATELSWSDLSFIVLQFLTMVFEVFQPTDRTEGDR